MKRLYQLITEQQFSRCHKQDKYKKLLFSLCFFHSVLLERRKFLMLGWNIQYGFNDSDFEVSENLLSIYLDEYEETPWDALKYLVSLASVGWIDIRSSNRYRTSAIFTDIWHFSDISLDIVNSSPRFLAVPSSPQPVPIAHIGTFQAPLDIDVIEYLVSIWAHPYGLPLVAFILRLWYATVLWRFITGLLTFLGGRCQLRWSRDGRLWQASAPFVHQWTVLRRRHPNTLLQVSSRF